jgi:hypothetical protein
MQRRAVLELPIDSIERALIASQCFAQTCGLVAKRLDRASRLSTTARKGAHVESVRRVRRIAPYPAYGAAIASATFLARRRGVHLPDRIGLGDLALLAVTTHKASRLLSKDSISAVIRAPFTEFVEPAGAGEVNEKPRGTGARHALGELFGCPFCLGQWVGTAFVGGFVVAPRATRAVASILSVVAASDTLQFGYAALERHEQHGG